VDVSDTLETTFIAIRCLDDAREALYAACQTDGPGPTARLTEAAQALNDHVKKNLNL